MVEDMMSFYTGNLAGGVPGLLPKPYYCAWGPLDATMHTTVDADPSSYRQGGKRVR